MEINDKKLTHERPSAQESIQQFGCDVLQSIRLAELLRGGADPEDPVYDQH